MLPKFLVAENTIRADGFGPEISLGTDSARLLVLTLDIGRVLEQEALQISVWGSEDKKDWGSRPLMLFPPKSYCGMYSQLLNLAKFPDVRYLRVKWTVNRWSKNREAPLFDFSVFAQESGARIAPANAHAATASVA